ncbi:unnamed protein product, partial [marine sediment metagenome]
TACITHNPCNSYCFEVECGMYQGCNCGNYCPANTVCVDNKCVSDCTPQCGSRECGFDGCYGTCGTCGSGEQCNIYTGKCCDDGDTACLNQGKDCTCNTAPGCQDNCSCDPDCGTACACDSDARCDDSCACDADCPCDCDTNYYCDPECSCDFECPCDCDTTYDCDDNCECDIECMGKKCGCDNAEGSLGGALLLALGLAVLLARKRRHA